MSAERQPDTDGAAEDTPEARRLGWKRYGFAIVPAIAVVELAAHFAQATSKVPDSDWLAARDAVKAEIHAEDLLVFAPSWVDPIGRSAFTDELATVEREARPDDTRFARAIEVSIRGAHLPELESWHVTQRRRIGAITLTTYENPSFTPVLDNLVSHFDSARVSVSRLEGARETSCPFLTTRSQTGAIGFGAAVPGDRFACPQGGFAGITVLQALDYRPHRCIYAPPQGGATVIRVRFAGVKFGNVLRGHHAVSWAQERYKEGAPVTLVWKVEGHIVGRLTHNDGDSWKPFELDTSELAGQTADLVAEVSAPDGHDRYYCFEADTR